MTFTKEIANQKIMLWYSKSRGYWESFSDIYVQPLDKIFLPESTKTSITDLIDTFLASRDKYIKYGRPHKLNFLLTGVPGSGKTSIVKAIALKYKRPVYILSFSKTMTDENIVDLVTEIKNNSILLLEDIDAFFMDRKAVDINVSFSCLINVLDGTLCKGNGVITVLTANNPERLDPALIRPGRIDKIIRFDYPKRADIEAAFMDLVDPSFAKKEVFEEFYNKIKKVRINMSGLVDYLFRYPTGFMDSIAELLEGVQVLQEIVNDKSDKLYC
jgi:chaperone BCS1